VNGGERREAPDDTCNVEHRDATVTALADLMGVGADRVLELMEMKRSLVSLDQVVGDSADRMLGEVIADPNADREGDSLEHLEWSFTLAEMLDQLSERQTAVVRMRFGVGTTHPHSLLDVGTHFGISRQAVRRLEQAALSKLLLDASSKEFADA